MRQIFVVSLILTVFAAVFAGGYWYAGGYESDLEVHGFVLYPLSVAASGDQVVDFDVAIADDFDERQVGLQIANSLKPNEGMWFVFSDAGILSFWMKDMVIPLDMIFVDSNFKIVSIVENVPPCAEVDSEQSNCVTYSSVEEAQYVLEVNAGTIERYGIAIGDKIEPPIL